MMHLITPSSFGAFSNEIAEMHRLRYRVFKERLDWDAAESDRCNGLQRLFCFVPELSPQ